MSEIVAPSSSCSSNRHPRVRCNYSSVLYMSLYVRIECLVLKTDMSIMMIIIRHDFICSWSSFLTEHCCDSVAYPGFFSGCPEPPRPWFFLLSGGWHPYWHRPYPNTQPLHFATFGNPLRPTLDTPLVSSGVYGYVHSCYILLQYAYGENDSYSWLWFGSAMSNRAEKDAVRWCHLTHQVFAGGISS